MAEVEIVAPRRSYEVDSGPDAEPRLTRAAPFQQDAWVAGAGFIAAIVENGLVEAEGSG